MKKVLGNITKYIFGAFGIAILGLLMSLTYQALGRIFPGSFSNQLWGLILFDIGAICWALAFVFASETVQQYAVSAIGFLTGFLGTLLMVGAEVVLGQNLITTNTQEIGQWMVYGFIGATALHAILLYAYHAGGQEIKQRIDVGIAKGEITTEAINQATKTLDEEKAMLAKTLKQDILSQVKRDLGLYPVEGTPFERKEQTTIEPLPAIHVPPEEYLRLEKQYPSEKGTFIPNQPIPHPTETHNGAGSPDNYGPLWKSSTNITPTLDQYAWVCLNCEATHSAGTRTCSYCKQPRTNGSPTTALPGRPPTKQLTPIKKDEPTSAKPPFQPE
jgi:hypothetical protein